MQDFQLWRWFKSISQTQFYHRSFLSCWKQSFLPDLSSYHFDYHMCLDLYFLNISLVKSEISHLDDYSLLVSNIDVLLYHHLYPLVVYVPHTICLPCWIRNLCKCERGQKSRQVRRILTRLRCYLIPFVKNLNKKTTKYILFFTPDFSLMIHVTVASSLIFIYSRKVSGSY